MLCGRVCFRQWGGRGSTFAARRALVLAFSAEMLFVGLVTCATAPVGLGWWGDRRGWWLQSSEWFRIFRYSSEAAPLTRLECPNLLDILSCERARRMYCTSYLVERKSIQAHLCTRQANGIWPANQIIHVTGILKSHQLTQAKLK